MKNSLKLVGFLLIAVILNSCGIDMTYQYDYGKKKKRGDRYYRYSSLEEKQFWISVDVSSDREEIRIDETLKTKYYTLKAIEDTVSTVRFIETKYYTPKGIEDTVSTVHFIETKLSFPDGTILEKKSRPRPRLGGGIEQCLDKDGKEYPCLDWFYTCDGFKKKLRRNKHINLKLVYDLDSLGAVTRKEKKYTLIKKKYYYLKLDHL